MGVPIIGIIMFGFCIGVPLFWETTKCALNPKPPASAGQLYLSVLPRDSAVWSAKGITLLVVAMNNPKGPRTQIVGF